MKSAFSPVVSSLRVSTFLVVLIGLCLIATTGCGAGSGASSTGPVFSGNTNVTVLLSSTANDQVTQFGMQLQTLTLTNQSGKALTLVSSQQPAEFVHLNGGIEPLTTVSIPQGIYTSAAVTLGGAQFVCLSQDPNGGLLISHYSIVNQGPVVNLASPITVTGSSMALALNLQVSSSAVFPSCYSDPIFSGYSMSPTFSLAPLTLSSTPTNAGNGLVSGLEATIASTGTTGSSLTLTIPALSPGTRTLSATANNATLFQGVSGFSALSPGMFVNVDGAIQSDGSLLATRIAVQETSGINESSGPLMSVDNISLILLLYGRTELGPLQTIGNQSGIYFETPYFDFSNAVFGISGQFTNLGSLPFVPSFNASSMVAGQNAAVTSPQFALTGGVYTPANTITLMPQTINATVVGSSTVGGFTDYTVSLASYDLFPQFAVQGGQTTVLNNPSEIEVYVDSNTQKLSTQALAPGSTLRFYGLVFNDNGTLRMDCAQVSDGVPTSSRSSVRGGVTAAEVKTVSGSAGTPIIRTATRPYSVRP